MTKYLANTTSYINYVVIFLKIIYINATENDKVPKLLVFSFGGLRWDYMKTHNLTNFKYLQSIGSYTDYITNQYSTESVPNQWSIVTGLNARYHGMLQNEMYDSEMKKKFYIKTDKLSKYRKSNEWFGRNLTFEPIWITNQKVKSEKRHSLAEWAGAEYLWNDQAAFWINELGSYSDLIDKIINLMTRERKQVNFGLFYLDVLDRTGQNYGPFSNEITQQLELIDKKFVGVLIERLKTHNLFDETNIIFTSDHGMTNVSEDSAIILSNHVDTKLFDFVMGGPVIVNIFMNNSMNFEKAYNGLKSIKNLKVYRNHEIPNQLNFNNYSRSGDLVLIADYGYIIYLNKQSNYPKGAHGYDGARHRSMNSIFIATGPAFKKNHNVEPFKIVDIYPLMCHILELVEKPNNGSLERVKSMLNIDLTNYELNLYIILSVTPVFLSTIAGIILFCTRNRSGPISKGQNSSSVAYKMLTMNDDENENENENGIDSDDNEAEIFSQI